MPAAPSPGLESAPHSRPSRAGQLRNPDTFTITLWFSFVVVQSLSRVRLFVTPRTAAHQASLTLTNSLSLLKLMSTEWVMPSNLLILCLPLLLLLSTFPSMRVFSNESVLCIRWPKYWSFSFSISPSNEYSGLISFRMDWFDLLAVQGALKSLLQHHCSKASILRCSTVFLVQLSHPARSWLIVLQEYPWATSTIRCGLLFQELLLSRRVRVTSQAAGRWPLKSMSRRKSSTINTTCGGNSPSGSGTLAFETTLPK